MYENSKGPMVEGQAEFWHGRPNTCPGSCMFDSPCALVLRAVQYGRMNDSQNVPAGGRVSQGSL